MEIKLQPNIAMAATVESVKQRAHELIDRLPDDANWHDVVEAMEVVEDIEAGLADSDAGRVVSNNEVRRQFDLPELPE